MAVFKQTRRAKKTRRSKVTRSKTMKRSKKYVMRGGYGRGSGKCPSVAEVCRGGICHSMGGATGTLC